MKICSLLHHICNNRRQDNVITLRMTGALEFSGFQIQQISTTARRLAMNTMTTHDSSRSGWQPSLVTTQRWIVRWTASVMMQRTTQLTHAILNHVYACFLKFRLLVHRPAPVYARHTRLARSLLKSQVLIQQAPRAKHHPSLHRQVLLILQLDTQARRRVKNQVICLQLLQLDFLASHPARTHRHSPLYNLAKDQPKLLPQLHHLRRRQSRAKPPAIFLRIVRAVRQQASLHLNQLNLLLL